MRSPLPLIGATVLAAFVAFAASCGDSEVQVRVEDLSGAEEPKSPTPTPPRVCAATDTELQATTDVNLRRGPSTEHAVVLVIPDGARVQQVSACSTDEWVEVVYADRRGWAHGDYLSVPTQPDETEEPDTAPDASAPVGGPDAGTTTTPKPTRRDAAISRAASGVGFSYWWGGSTWDPKNRSSTAIGSCTGSCPNCTHSGTYGADCSGYAAKVWQVPTGNTSLTTRNHPYVSGAWMNSTSYWTTVKRDTVRKADAFATEGHIFIYVSRTSWNALKAYEAKGCSYGIVHNVRSVSTAYVASSRVGY
nr:invasion associated secreted endopeptidase [uncultured bacterium]